MSAPPATVESTRRALQRLARQNGVQTSYLGTDGRRHHADAETLVAVLRALDVPVDSARGAPDALRGLSLAQARRAVEPVVVHRPGDRCEVTISLDAATSPRDVWIGLRLEDGTEEHRRLTALPHLGSAVTDVEGTPVVARTVALDHLDPAPGYHRIEVEGPGVEASAVLVAAPRSCPRPERGWGVFTPLHALRSARDWGVGSYRDLGRLGAWVRQQGGVFAGTLPLLATFAREPWADASPYLPVSRSMWNELFVDVEALPELAASPAARAELRSLTDNGTFDSLRRSARSDPAAVLATKQRVLRHMAHALCDTPSSRRDEFDAYVRGRPELPAYARFRVACERVGRPWTEWGASSPGSLPPGGDDESGVLAYLYAQWACDSQLAGAGRAGRTGAGLYLDIPVGVHPAGFDPWRWPQVFAPSASGGAPPDTFSPTGQDWGFPPWHPERIREDGYRYVIEGWRHCLRHAALVRIDHIAGLHRLFWVPHGVDPSRGAYVRYRGDELHAVLMLEADRAGTAVVGEDLGTVPTTVRRAMARDGILSSWVLQFASQPGNPAPRARRSSMASLGTHDLPTFDAYWHGADIEDRLVRGELDDALARAERNRRAAWREQVLEAVPEPHGRPRPPTEAGSPSPRPAQTTRTKSFQTPASPEPPDVSSVSRVGGAGSPNGACGNSTAEVDALRRLLGHLAAGPADLVVVDMEDLWLEPESQNRPGTGGDAANFRRRWRYPLEQAEEDAQVVALLGIVDHLRRGGTQ